MNKIKRALILAAGKGSRLNPVTIETPKPLIRVNGVRMIDTIIKGLYQNGIQEIYIVVGYLKDKFNILLEDYPNIKLIENKYYEETNNISSLYVAREFLEEIIITDADLIIKNPSILNPYFEKSGYSCSWCKEYTNEWFLQTDNCGKITNCSIEGGKDGYRLWSISRWTKEDGKKLKKYVEEEFINKNNTTIYWDNIAMFCYPEEFDLHVYEIEKEDIVEIDNYQELIAIDNSYANFKKAGEKNENKEN